MPIWAYIGGGALLMGLLGGWTVRDWKADADLKKAQDALIIMKDKMQAKVDLKSEEYEQWRSEIEPSKIETRNTVREIYRDREIPAQCAVPDDAVGLLEAVRATTNSAATGQPIPTVSGGPANSSPID